MQVIASLLRIQGVRGARVIVFLCILALFFGLNGQIPARLAAISSPPRMLIYLLIIANCLGVLLACVTARPLWAGLGLALAGGNFLVGASFFRIRGRSLTLLDSQSLLEGVANVGDVLRQFRPSILFVLLQIGLLLGLLLVARKLEARRSNQPLFAFSLAMVAGYFGALGLAGDTAVGGFPTIACPALSALTLTGDLAIRHLRGSGGPAMLFQELPLDPAVRHVVLVIDESIEGARFNELCGSSGAANLRNLGVAYSYSNNSACSNLMLRRGADPQDLGGTVHRFPSLFQVALHSGFSTSYLDCQGVLNDPTVQDYFDGPEKALIGTTLLARSLGREQERDLNGLGALKELLDRPGRSFTLVNKVGTHFPYRDNLPADVAGAPDPYAVSVRRTTLQWLDRLGSDLPLGSLVFYTSDHGQNFTGKVSHGNFPGECVVSEWTVPMVILASPDLRNKLERIDQRWQDRASHAAMVEAVRNLLGQRCPSIGSLWLPPGPVDFRLHRAYYGSPLGLFGRQLPYLMIDMDRRAFTETPTPGAP